MVPFASRLPTLWHPKALYVVLARPEESMLVANKLPHPRVWGIPVKLGTTTLCQMLEMRGLMDGRHQCPAGWKGDASIYRGRRPGVELHWQVASDGVK